VDQLLIALDVESAAKALALADSLRGIAGGFKIGSRLFTSEGPSVVRALVEKGDRVFLDLKFHDIPNTVAAAVREATRLGVFMLNIHASGGLAMARAAAEAAVKAAGDFGIPRPLCLGVTVLTSLDRKALQREVGVPASVAAHVLHLAGLAQAAGLDGCVASPQEISLLRLAMGQEWVIVTPGIRPAEIPPLPPGGLARGAEPVRMPDRRSPPLPPDDQVRIATPRRALAAGANYLVVGRPISGAADPAAAATAIVDELRGP
jgi:orotidine-5'-phosphate decarboxylase